MHSKFKCVIFKNLFVATVLKELIENGCACKSTYWLTDFQASTPLPRWERFYIYKITARLLFFVRNQRGGAFSTQLPGDRSRQVLSSTGLEQTAQAGPGGSGRPHPTVRQPKDHLGCESQRQTQTSRRPSVTLSLKYQLLKQDYSE